MPPDELLARHVRRIAAGPARETGPDGTLLDRFLSTGDEAAFAALVARHGPMVRGVCRRVLGDDHAVDDALQATFLVLALRAASVRPRSAVAAWLHGVARRVALKARTAEARRRRHETLVEAPIVGSGDPLDALTARELLALLDEEVARLPEAHRAAVVLCGLEGRSQEEAARVLGSTPGSVKGRLERGRRRLHERLTRRGVTLPAALLTLGLGQSALPLPACRAAEIADAVLALSRSSAEGSGVAALAGDAMKGVSLGKLRSGLVLLLAGGVLTAVAVGLHAGSTTAEAQAAPEQRPTAAEKRETLRLDLAGDPLPSGALARLGTVRFRNPDWCSSLVFTPDGRSLVAGGRGGIRVLDPTSGKLVRWFGHELNQVHGPVSVSPDGNLVAVGGWGKDGSAVYELATGRRLFGFGSDGQITTPRFSPDGRTLATINSNLFLEVLSLPSGRLLSSWREHEPNVFNDHLAPQIAFLRDNKTVLTAAERGIVRHWESATGKEIARYETGADAIHELVVSPDGSKMAFLSYIRKDLGGGATRWSLDSVVRVWDLDAGKESRRIVAPPGRPVYGLDENAFAGVAFTPDGKKLLTGGFDRVLRVWDVRTGVEERRFTGFDNVPNPIAITPDGKRLAAGGQAVSLRDWATGRDPAPTVGHAGDVESVALSSDGRLIATGGSDQAIRVWDARTSRLVGHFTEPEGHVTALLFAEGGKLLVSAEVTGVVRAWDLAAGRESTKVKVAGYRSLALAPDGKTVAAKAENGVVVLREASSLKEVRRLLGNAEGIEGLTFTPDGKNVLAWSNDHHLHRWDVRSGRHAAVRCLGLGEKASPWAAAFSPDARLVGFIGQEPHLVVADAATGRDVCHFDHPTQKQILAAAFSPDGRTFAWEDQNDRTVRLGEVVSGKVRHSLAGHGGRVRSLAFSADGKRLVSGADDTTALVWDLAGPLPAEANRPATAAELAEAWDRLADTDAERAYRAVRRLAADPGRAVPLLRERLRADSTAPDAATLDRLVAALDGEQFAGREKAFAELERMGEAALHGLRERAARAVSAEARRRIDRLLEKQDPARPSPRKLHEVRAVEVLEAVGTVEARRLLETLAKGGPEARLTREARAALARLDRRPPRQP